MIPKDGGRGDTSSNTRINGGRNDRAGYGRRQEKQVLRFAQDDKVKSSMQVGLAHLSRSQAEIALEQAGQILCVTFASECVRT